MNRLLHTSAALLLVSGLFLAACGDDTSADGDPDAGPEADAADAGGDTGTTNDASTEVGPLECADIPIEVNAGEVCTADQACADGLCVATETGSQEGICFQLCAPDVCSEICDSDEECRGGLTDSEGNALTFADGTEAGVCMSSTGDVGAFGQCTAQSLCGAGSECIPFTTDPEPRFGTCLPTCEAQGAPCDSFMGFDATCSLTLSDGGGNPAGNACAIDCTDTGSCPDGMTCYEIMGGSICVQPEG